MADSKNERLVAAEKIIGIRRAELMSSGNILFGEQLIRFATLSPQNYLRRPMEMQSLFQSWSATPRCPSRRTFTFISSSRPKPMCSKIFQSKRNGTESIRAVNHISLSEKKTILCTNFCTNFFGLHQLLHLLHQHLQETLGEHRIREKSKIRCYTTNFGLFIGRGTRT